MAWACSSQERECILYSLFTMYLQSAQLNLQLLIPAREAVLREARNWLLKFNLESFPELVTIVSGQRNTAFRMVLGCWDMAVSLVTTGAIEADAFRAAHGEIFAAFSKIQPYLASCALSLQSRTRKPCYHGARSGPCRRQSSGVGKGTFCQLIRRQRSARESRMDASFAGSVTTARNAAWYSSRRTGGDLSNQFLYDARPSGFPRGPRDSNGRR